VPGSRERDLRNGLTIPPTLGLRTFFGGAKHPHWWWHFLTGDAASIKRATNAAGFSYQWDSVTGQFVHVSGVLVTTPDGILSRYFYGIEYSPKELRLALVESGQGRIGSLIDEILHRCYVYDPETGRYGAAVKNLLRVGGVLTLAAMATFFVMMRRRELRSPLEGRV